MRIFLISILSLFISITALADITDTNAVTCDESLKPATTTEHTTTIKGQVINYSATIGFMEVTSADQSTKACIFYTAYTVKPNGVTLAPRPLLFAFNGGPGSASLWLHLGVLGPKRVDMGADGLTPPSSLDLIPNEFSPIDITDIVLIDPVATGFSHPEADGKADKFFGVENDYTSIGAFVQNYLIDNQRWDSPKYIMGESYGGIRGSLLTNYLQDQLGISVNGLFLISPALSNTSLDFGAPDNNVPYWAFFPTYATTAWYHGKIAAKYQNLTVDQVYTQARDFAFTKLRDALDQGDNLDQKSFDDMAQQVSDFVGLDKDTVTEANLQIDTYSYFGGLLQKESEVIGRYDSRFVGQLTGGGRDYFDPSSTATNYPFTAGINQYLRVDLGFPLSSPYNTLVDVNWSSGSSHDGPDVMSAMASALAQNSQLKVFIASGYYDLACPMGTVEYELSQLPGGAKLRSRVQQKRFVGGHMMYINPPSLAQLKTELSIFITGK